MKETAERKKGSCNADCPDAEFGNCCHPNDCQWKEDEEIAIEKTIEKSQEQANIIISIAFQVILLDTDYCREVAKDMMQQASRQESMAVLNPNHPQIKNEILRTKAEALSCLVDYVEALKKVDELQMQCSKDEVTRTAIQNLFI